MTTKHTNEQWIIEINPTIPEGKQIAAFSEDGNRILQVVVRSFKADSDIALIAAAPKLLLALENMVGYVNDTATCNSDRAMVAAMRTVIAEAKGEIS